MKIFTNWKENVIPSFVMFLAREARRQKSRLRYYYERFAKNGEMDLMSIYQIQQGQTIEAVTMFIVAKEHFNLHKRKY